MIRWMRRLWRRSGARQLPYVDRLILDQAYWVYMLDRIDELEERIERKLSDED